MLAHVWAWFGELQLARTGNGFGSNPITFLEIQAWAALMGHEPTPWEVLLLKKLDRIYLDTTAKAE